MEYLFSCYQQVQVSPDEIKDVIRWTHQVKSVIYNINKHARKTFKKKIMVSWELFLRD